MSKEKSKERQKHYTCTFVWPNSDLKRIGNII